MKYVEIRDNIINNLYISDTSYIEILNEFKIRK